MSWGWKVEVDSCINIISDNELCDLCDGKWFGEGEYRSTSRILA